MTYTSRTQEKDSTHLTQYIYEFLHTPFEVPIFAIHSKPKYLQMDSQKLNLFFIQNAKYFTSLQAADLRERMATLNDESVLLCTSQLKDPVVMLLISFFAGGLGIDRFILEDIGIGIGKLLTCGCCGLWWLVDLIYIMDATRDKNYQTMLTAITQLQ